MKNPKSSAKLEKAKTFKELKSALDNERKELVENLLEKKWFKKTRFDLQKQLLTLPEEFDGFLMDLGNRPEEIGQVEILALEKLAVGNYLAIPVFKVRSLLTNEVYTYEYASWKYGKYTGFRGILFVEVDNQIKFFITRKAEKFAIADRIYDAFGGLDLKFSSDRFINLPLQVENRLKNLLALKNLRFKRFIDLGLFSPDAGLTNEKVGLFAAIINLEDAKLIESRFNTNKNVSKTPTYELGIYPIERMFEMVAKSDDSFFLACVARLMALNIIKL